MAPALIDHTIAGSTATAAKEYEKDKKSGIYKEAFAQSVHTTNYETEINGSDTVTPAKYPHYLPCRSFATIVFIIEFV